MYEEYFGLERPPFKITPDTSLFYDGGKRGDILAALVYAIHRGEGIIKVVGEVGSGKTTLCRMLQLKLPDTVEIVYIANPSVSSEDILFVVAHELSLQVSREASKHVVMHLLQDYLLQRHMENKQVVLFVEEAQGMPLDTLEEIRLLSNLETDENKLLQIILFGQPELDHNLSEQSIRQLRERITHNFELPALTRDEIHNYLNFRMREVGYTGPELINAAVAKKVEQYSAGLLRRINIIADKILLSAFAEGTHNLTPKHVTAAVNDSAFDQPAAHNKPHIFWWLGLLIIVTLLFALYQSRAYWMTTLAIEWSQKQEYAVKNDNSPSDTVPQAKAPLTEIYPDEARVDASTHADLEPAPAQSEVATQRESETRVLQHGTEMQSVEATIPGEAEAAMPEQAEAAMPEQAEATISEETALTQAETENTPSDDSIAQNALGPTASNVALATETGAAPGLSTDYGTWLDTKLQESREWLSQANRDSVSIQVLTRRKSAVRELVSYLHNEWPLELSKTYLYETNKDGRIIYRVFYSEFDTLSRGRNQLELLPESVKKNSPYLLSVYRMQKAWL